MAEQARVNNPCESRRDGRGGGQATVAEIIRNFGAIGNGRAVLLRPVGWAQGKEKSGWIISVLARQNIVVDPLRNWRHTGVYGATTSRAPWALRAPTGAHARAIASVYVYTVYAPSRCK